MLPRKWLVSSLIVLLGLLVWMGNLQAQSGYNLFWHSVDGGGAVSGAGGYTLRGVAGQADAGQQSAGGYTLTGGMMALPSPSTEDEDSSIYLPRLAK